MQYDLKAMRCFIADENEQDRMAIALGAVQAANAFPAWIVCPANRSQAWHHAIERHLPGKKLPTCKDAAGNASADLVLINYETLDAAGAVIQHLNRRSYGPILDEFGGRTGFFQRCCLGQENGAARLSELSRLLRTRCLIRRPRLSRLLVGTVMLKKNKTPPTILIGRQPLLATLSSRVGKTVGLWDGKSHRRFTKSVKLFGFSG